jgi:hypothetical protein
LDPLDLAEILPAYREHLGVGTAGVNFVDERRRGDRDPHDHDLIPKSLYAHKRGTFGEKPLRVGVGPQTCSTCTDVVSAKPSFAWDVNGWYRAVGVPWPYVDVVRGALARAYIASGGQTSARATYCFKRLLDKPSRTSYDLMSLGDVFLDDLYVQDAMKAKAQAEASARSAKGTFIDAVTVLDEWGYLLRPDESDFRLDGEPEPVQDEGTPEDDDWFDPAEWTYSYWLWRTYGGLTSRIEQWQTLLVSALSARKARVDLAVGFMGKQPQDFVVGLFDGHWIVFLDDKTEPTMDMAVRAADALLHEIQKHRSD